VGSLASCAPVRLAYQKTIQYIRERLELFDWGCGNGHFSFFLLQLRRPRRTPIRLKQFHPFCLGGSLPFHAGGRCYPNFFALFVGHVDAVFSVGVLEHVHDLAEIKPDQSGKLSAVLKPGGLLCVFHLPNRFSWIEFMVRSLNRWKRNKRHEPLAAVTPNGISGARRGTSLRILDQAATIYPRNSLNRLPKAVAEGLGLRRSLMPAMTS